MIQIMSDLPDNVVGFKAVGEVDSEDYANTLLPAIDQALEGSDKLRFLYVLDDDFSGYSAGAAWQDTKLGIEHFTKFEKIAIVTDTDWIEHSVKAFGWMIPGDVKLFDDDDLDDAVEWVSS